uniref:Uncharacterized protein n=1 Tax=Moniliophthora roreri TaxID=221103 RepID=A0A0W0FQM7_MONRR
MVYTEWIFIVLKNEGSSKIKINLGASSMLRTTKTRKLAWMKLRARSSGLSVLFESTPVADPTHQGNVLPSSMLMTVARQFASFTGTAHWEAKPILVSETNRKYIVESEGAQLNAGALGNVTVEVYKKGKQTSL